MNKQKENRGITLISLIITIIVMLILVAVTVTTVINSGLIGKTQDAAEGLKTEYEKESKINNITVKGQEYGSITDYINRKENKPTITAGQRASQNSEYSDGKDTAVIPAGFTVSGVKGEKTIDGGLVIYLIPEGVTVDWDGTSEDANAKTVAYAQKNYDQFVWIPIPRTNINDMYMCQREDGTKSCKITVKEEDGEKVAYCTTHNSFQMAGRLYATTSGEKFDYNLTTQTYSANSGLREPAVVTDNSEGTGDNYDNKDTNLGELNGILGTSFTITTSTNNTGTANTDFKTYLQKEYNEVVKSVYLNEGFYVGRYETSNLTTSSGTAVQVVKGTKNGINDMDWYYMYAQQVKYAENKNLDLNSVGSTMIQGAAYDQLMKFVDTDNFSVTDTTNNGVNHSSSKIQETGSQSTDQSKNIYDLEGNGVACTIEAYGTYSRVCRGGSYYFGGSASCRALDGGPEGSAYYEGSLAQLYVK